MIKRTCPTRSLENIRGGNGTVPVTDFSTLEETCGHVRLFAHMTLNPGCSVGYHTHETDVEYYYILSGTVAANDNGEHTTMHPGDVMVTRDGAGHGLENLSEQPVEFIALIVND